ncbi:MAG TPA: DUF4419 domain-containing protein [Kofleriaceae bacterium]|nr:DUF4419 domain-containing protein [Kofleriaceae bacterium]
MAITFGVDDVPVATAPAATVSVRELIGEHLHVGIDGERVLPVRGVHPLLAAVHHAFVEHRPLVLSPDAVWLTIAQGVARHVRLHAETLRPRLVRHVESKTLEVRVLGLPDEGTQWAEVVASFRALIAGELGAGLARLLTCDFSTTGPADRTASEIVLMDAMSPYFDYQVSIVCGIPSITLLGSPADWRKIRARIDVIAELELAWWTSSLAPIADRLVAAAEGRPDPEFFRAIYKPQPAYGWDLIPGWIARLYPYVGRAGAYDQRNPLLALALGAELPAADDSGYYTGPGIRAHDVPAERAQVPVRVVGAGAQQRIFFEGGVLAVEVDADGGLRPRCGFVIRAADREVDAVVERIQAQHRAIPGADDPALAHDAALRTLFRAVGEATLFEARGPWHLLPADRRDPIVLVAGRRTELATRVVDLPDRTFLAIADVEDAGTVVIRLRQDALGSPAPVESDDGIVVFARARPELRERPLVPTPTRERLESIPVVGTSLVDLLAGALANGGDLTLPSSGPLLDRLPSLWDSTYHAAPLLERLRRDHQIVERDAEPWQLFDVIRSGVVRIGGERWIVKKGNREDAISFEGDVVCAAQPYIVLPDGTALAAVVGARGRCVVRIRPAEHTERVRRPARGNRPARVDRISREDPATVPVLGRSFVDVLGRVLDTGALPGPVDTLAGWYGDRIRGRNIAN